MGQIDAFTAPLRGRLAADRGVELTLVETAMLRCYTGDFFKPWNNALRGLDEDFKDAPEALGSWATCIAVCCSALVKMSHALPRDSKGNPFLPAPETQEEEGEEEAVQKAPVVAQAGPQAP